jgi:ABC-2 type transport system permease protein
VLKPAEIENIKDMHNESDQFVEQLTIGSRSVFLREFKEAIPKNRPQEEDIAIALKRLTENQHPLAIFLNGNGERPIDLQTDSSYWILATSLDERASLINQGFDVASLPVDSLSTVKSSAFIVLADPQSAFTGRQLNLLDSYIASGGNILITAEPRHALVLSSVFAQLGVKFKDSPILQPDKQYPDNLAIAKITTDAVRSWPSLENLYRTKAIITMPGAGELGYLNNGLFHVVSILADKVPLALALTRIVKGREQRIFISGDADFMTEQEFQRNIDNQNNVFPREIFRWLTYGEYPVDASHPITINQVYIGRNSLSLLKFGFYWFWPGLILGSGLFLLIRRMRG